MMCSRTLLVVAALVLSIVYTVEGYACQEFLDCNHRYENDFHNISDPNNEALLCRSARDYLYCLQAAQTSPICADDKPTIAEAIEIVERGLNAECSGASSAVRMSVVVAVASLISSLIFTA